MYFENVELAKNFKGYFYSVKDNQPTLKKYIEDYIQDDFLWKTIDIFELPKNKADELKNLTLLSQLISISLLTNLNDQPSLAYVR